MAMREGRLVSCVCLWPWPNGAPVLSIATLPMLVPVPATACSTPPAALMPHTVHLHPPTPSIHASHVAVAVAAHVDALLPRRRAAGGGRWERLARAGEGEGGYAFEGHGWPMTMTAKGEEGTWADDQACGRLLWRVLVLPCGCTAPHRTAPHHTTTAAAAY